MCMLLRRSLLRRWWLEYRRELLLCLWLKLVGQEDEREGGGDGLII